MCRSAHAAPSPRTGPSRSARVVCRSYCKHTARSERSFSTAQRGVSAGSCWYIPTARALSLILCTVCVFVCRKRDSLWAFIPTNARLYRGRAASQPTNAKQELLYNVRHKIKRNFSGSVRKSKEREIGYWWELFGSSYLPRTRSSYNYIREIEQPRRNVYPISERTNSVCVCMCCVIHYMLSEIFLSSRLKCDEVRNHDTYRSSFRDNHDVCCDDATLRVSAYLSRSLATLPQCRRRTDWPIRRFNNNANAD